ncbi:hypothetical protein Mboo_1232 [Methanoregula boonei 6A8]|jgi:uncharacterized membrane protein (DUF373 family)|uniref:Phosphate-starvation-inducible E-like protein n=1 Tax=Methanoregula boonei (strain DSM 21154 / JCM 14090 / 6A8) TaxID=456442 RepID=A7I7N9_METB6|nr:phosphate-starvation-inducible PsiE family protein [Methanoregula boonei]ABS55750.1 hypothetical protein Mboo_1232 [Methanoregula boonei 6A8]
MIEEINKFERIVYTILIILLGAVLVCAIAELIWTFIGDLFNPGISLLDNKEIVAVLGSFLLVLITVELLDTMKAYIVENVIHVEVVVLLAIIAIARKVILLDPTSIPSDSGELVGIGIIIVGLAAAYYLIKKADVSIRYPPKKEESPAPEKQKEG